MRPSRASVVAVALLAAACGGTAQEESSPTTAAGAPTLRASVGTEQNPNEFVIGLVDEDGNPVTELPAGEYNIEVSDPTDIHNFHLIGGGVDEKTGVTEKTDTTWVVTFKPGEYRYMCDPHPSMNGHFTVD